MQNVKFEKFARRCSRRHKQTKFSDADFLGALRVKALTTTAADDNLIFFYYFSEKIRLESLCESSACKMLSISFSEK